MRETLAKETLLKCEFPESIMEKLKTREEKKYGKD